MLRYALKDGEVVHIDEVPTGATCGCVCLQCGGALVAKNGGGKKVHHFSHKDDAKRVCEWANESALHHRAKKILQSESKIALPLRICDENVVDYHALQSFGIEKLYERAVCLDISTVVLESKIGRIIPDIVITDEQGRTILVEIFVTHRIDEEKVTKIRSMCIPTMEIDLSEVSREISDNELRDILVGDSTLKRWIWHEYIDLYNDEAMRIIKVEAFRRKAGLRD